MHTAKHTEMRFTKKPVTIEAIQWTGKNLREVITFTDGPPDTRSHHAGMAWEAYADLVARDGLKIYTLEGKMLANVGDWIIRGVKGEFYPCKPDIFEATYSPATLVEAQQPAPSAAAAGQQAGWRWVPTEPTEAMFTRFSQQIEEGVVYVGGFLNAYRCMLDAAPQPSPTPQADMAIRAALASVAQAPQQEAVALLPEHLTLAVDQWFAQNTGLGGCSDKDVAQLAAIFYGVTYDGGRESVDDALAVVESFGPGIEGLNDTYARQVILAQEVLRLHGECMRSMDSHQTTRNALRAALDHIDMNALRISHCKDAAAIDAAQAYRQVAPAMPPGWVPCTIEFDGSGPEEVAYGPQILMNRLGRWLRKYFDHVVASKAQAAPAADATTVSEGRYGFWVTHPEHDPEGFYNGGALSEREKADGWVAVALTVAPQPSTTPQADSAPSAAAPVGEAPLPLLVRDIAADLGTTPIQVCTALAQLGFGGHSVNMAVTPRMAQSLRAHFASPTPQADSAHVAAPADTVVLDAALRAIHQAIDLIGEPNTERLRTVRRVLRGAVVVAEDSTAPQADSQPEPVHGDLLPPVGSRVFIRHGRDDDAHACTVTGYYAWGDLHGDKRLHRVFVRMVYEGTSIEQARMLCDCYPTAGAALAAVPRPSTTAPADSQPALDEREAFELWARPRGLQLRRNEALGHYGNIDTQRCWEGWQARAPADSVTAPAGGGVVAPSEPTSSMYRAAQMILLPTGDDDGGSIMLNTSQVRALWQAMLAAAPTQPTQAADSVLEDAALPMQPICAAADGVVRFKKNRMVSDMYEFSQPRGFGLNEMARRDYTQEERMQFAQLIGYSVSGYGDLSYASPESVAKADTMAEALIAARKQGCAT